MAKRSKNEEIKITDASFLDKDGQEVLLRDAVSKEDCWYLSSKNSWILRHNAIKKIALLAGISKNFEIEESQTVQPDYRNEQEHIIRVTIHCNAKKSKEGKGCVHSDEDHLTITGEANRINTPNRGRGYLRKMAEKRAFDIAVLEHLDLYSKVYSEEESDDFAQTVREPVLMPGTKEFQQVTDEVNAILKAKVKEDFKKINISIKKNKTAGKYSDQQLRYLRELYQKKYGEQNTKF